MSNGYQVNHTELTGAGTKTDGKASEAQGIQDKVNAADGQVPEKAWGLIGQVKLYGFYTNLLGELKDHVAEMIQGVQKLASDITATADLYKQNEDDVAQKFKDIEGGLGGGSSSAPPAPPGSGPGSGPMSPPPPGAANVKVV